MSDEIKALFDQSRTPAPHADLAERIAVAAATQRAGATAPAAAPAANDNRRLWPALAAIAATLVIGLFAFTGSVSEPSEQEEWAQFAEVAGFAELHDWVEGVE